MNFAPSAFKAEKKTRKTKNQVIEFLSWVPSKKWPQVLTSTFLKILEKKSFYHVITFKQIEYLIIFEGEYFLLTGDKVN